MNNEQKTSWTIAVIAALLVGIGLGWMFWGGKSVEDSDLKNDKKAGEVGQTETSSAEKSEIERISSSSDQIVVDDQVPGTAVTVREVSILEPSWITIREDRDGGLGNILGAQWLPAGTHKNFDVELLRGIIPEGTYYAVIFTDDGDRIFNYKKDVMLSGDDGLITAKFQAFAKE